VSGSKSKVDEGFLFRAIKEAPKSPTRSPMGRARTDAETAARNLRSFVPSLAFAGSILQNMHRVRDALIAAGRSEFRQADAMPGVVGPIEESFMHAREMGSPANVSFRRSAPREDIRCP
jgi:hypothetical protein